MKLSNIPKTNAQNHILSAKAYLHRAQEKDTRLNLQTAQVHALIAIAELLEQQVQRPIGQWNITNVESMK